MKQSSIPPIDLLAPACLAAFWSGLVYAGDGAAPTQVARAGLLAVGPLWLTLIGLARSTGFDGPTAREILAPWRWLSLAGLAWVLPLPFLPTALGLVVATASVFRIAAAVGSGGTSSAWGGAAVFAILAPGLILFQTTVIHDAFQYQATAVSMFLGGDYDLFEELFLHNSHRSYNPYAEGSIRYLGVPLLEIPALAIGHGLARLLTAIGIYHPADGFSQPYTLSISLVSCAAGLVGVGLLWRWLVPRVGRRFALAATALLLWASALPFFLYLWHGWTHTYSLLFSVLFLLWFDRLRGPATDAAPARAIDWYVLGLLGGALALIWPVNALILIVPMVELGFRLRNEPRAAILAGTLLIAGSAIAFAPQFAGYYGATGSPRSSTYAKVRDYFDWWNPALLAMLFSPSRHGLFTWHPILLPAFAGLTLLRDRRLALGLGLWIAVQLYVMSCWSVWWTGIGFGNRFFVNLTPAAALGAAALLKATWGPRRGDGRLSWRQFGIAAFAVGLVFANLSLLAAYRIDAVAMGIAAPRYAQDPPRSPIDLARILLFETPPTLATLTTDFWVNLNYFAARVSPAAPPLSSWLAVLLVATTLLAAAALAGRLATRARHWSPRASVRIGMAASALSLLTGMWLAVGPDRGRDQYEFYRFDTREEILMPHEKLSLVPQGYLQPVRRIEVVSFLTYAIALRVRRPVALLRVFVEGRPPLVFPLIAGVHTAEVSIGRLGRPPGAQRLVHEWMARAASNHLYPAWAYAAAFDLGESLRVQWVEIEMLPQAGDLVVRDVFLEQ